MPYIPLKQKIVLVRSRTEHLFGSQETARSLAASQLLDRLIYRVLLIRCGRFRFGYAGMTAKRKARYRRCG